MKDGKQTHQEVSSSFYLGAGIGQAAGSKVRRKQGWTRGVGRCSIDRMKKTKPGDLSPARRGSSAPKTVDAYLEGVAEPAHSMIVEMRALIRTTLPEEAQETISYRMPAFKLKRVLVWFAAFKSHCSLFPSAAVIEQFKDELKGFTVSKGTVQFPMDKPLPAALIRKLVKARLEQSEGK